MHLHEREKGGNLLHFKHMSCIHGYKYLEDLARCLNILNNIVVLDVLAKKPNALPMYGV